MAPADERKRTLLFTMKLSRGERAELDRMAKKRGMTAADLLRSLVRNDARYAFEWVERACAKCHRLFRFRSDVPPPYLCTRHELPPVPRPGRLGPRLVKGAARP